MSHLTRRTIIAGASASAAASLAGCVSSNPNPVIYASTVAPPAPPAYPPTDAADAIAPNYNEVYAERRDGNFIVPAVNLAQINSAFLRKNIAFATKEAPGTIIIDPASHYLYHV